MWLVRSGDVFATEHDNGLPAGTTFESATGSGVAYIIQPAVFNNVLQIGAGQHATLTLLHPAPYREIAILSSSGNASETAIGIFTINYADGSSIAAAYNTFDWCNDARHPQAVLTPAAGFPGTARNCPGNLSFPHNRMRFVYNTDCSDFNIYETVIPTDNRKNIVSFTFTAPDSANWTNIFGVSGIQ